MARQYVIQPGGPTYDLSRIDFEALRKQFEEGRKRTAAEKLRGRLNAQITEMVRRNHSRVDYQQEFQQLIDEYNQGAMNIETFFNDLVDLARGSVRRSSGTSRRASARRADALRHPHPPRPAPDRGAGAAGQADRAGAAGKAQGGAAGAGLAQAAAGPCRREVSHRAGTGPPAGALYANLYQEKCASVYTHIYDSYYGGGQSLYG